MRAAQLYIKDTGKYIQLGQGGDFPFTLSKSIAEIENVSKRNKSHSLTFKVPATEDNVAALGYAHIIGTDLDAVNVYKKPCFVIVNGNVIEDGYVYILKATRDREALEFECQFVGGNESWVVALQSLKMSDITVNTSGTSLTINYNDTNVLSRVLADPRTMLDPSYIFVNPYMYKFSDSDADNYDSTETYEGVSRKAKGKDFWVAFRLDYLIDAIFGTATNPLVQQVYGFDSFQLDSDFLTDNATHGFFDNIYYSDRSQDDYPNVSFGGSASSWGSFLPTDVTMLDFFMKVCKTFNLIFSFDGITLKVEPREDWTSWNGTTYSGFYSGDIDWSEKVSTQQEIKYKTSNYKRQVRLSWGVDTYPIDENMYPFLSDPSVSQPEVRYIIDLDSNNEEGITDIELPFNTSPSKFYQAKFDRVRVRGFVGPITEDEANQPEAITFDPENTYSNRLFIFKSGSAPMGMPRHVNLISTVTGRYTGLEAYLYTPTWRRWIYKQADGTLSTQLGYPFMYNCMTINPYVHTDETLALGDGSSLSSIVTKVSDFDTIESVDVADVSVTRQPSDATDLGRLTDIASNDIDDVNLGIYNANTVTMVDGIYERFWKTTLDKLITTRTLATKVLLTRNEFVNLDISKYYTLMNQRFIINKVNNFDPTLDEQMVEVELIAVDSFRSSSEQEPPAANLFLDQFGEDCQAAYSVRKLRTDYSGSAFRVRRDSDDTEQDIGFDADGNLDESALTTFVGSNSGYIVKWYDQTTNGNNASQSVTTRQMIVVSAGTINKIGTKVAPNSFRSRTYYSMDTAVAVTPPQTTILLLNPTVTGGNYHAIGEDLAGTYRFGGHDDRLYLNGGSIISTADGAIAQPHMIAVGLCDGANSEIRANGSQEATGNTSGNNYSINSVFGPVNSTSNMRGNMQEVLIYTADKSSDIDDIESNINTYFSVYS